MQIHALPQQRQLTHAGKALASVLVLLGQRQHQQPQNRLAQQRLRFGFAGCFEQFDAIAVIAQRREYIEAQAAPLDRARERQCIELPAAKHTPRLHLRRG